MFSPRILTPCVLLLLAIGHADVRECGCDVARPETLAARECSLCKEVEGHPATPEFFTLRDSNPNKPNRLLAVPRFHGSNPQHLGNMPADQRTAYWTFAIAKAREAWGEQWGLAINSVDFRTQCHMHIHMGKLREDVENGYFRVAATPADIGTPEEMDGMWVHPADGKFHVHTANKTPEILLYR
jgi:hypothetical protein